MSGKNSVCSGPDHAITGLRPHSFSNPLFNPLNLCLIRISKGLGAWLQNFRRVQVRYDRIFSVYQGFVHLACLIIVLRRL
jgi:transposase